MTLLLTMATALALGLFFGDVVPITLPLACAGALTFTLAWVALIDALFTFEPAWDELHLATTSDGWTIPLYRYRCEHPRGAVLLVHGIYATMHLFDLGGEESLARHLRGRGYDVYCLELRDIGRHGRRSSRRRVRKEGASFDEYVREDLPAAVAHVCAASGFERIDYIGHSMGGMVFYPYGGTAHGHTHIRRAVTFGALGGLPRRGLARFLPIPWPLLESIPHYGVREASRYLLAPLVGLAFWVERRFLNPRHMSRSVRRRFFANGVANSPYTLLHHFGTMYKSASIASRDGRDDYRALMQKNTVPTLVIAGGADHIAPLPLVRLGFETLAGEKEWLLAEGFGHADLVFGGASRSDIWPVMEQWLRNDPGDTSTPT